MKNKQNNDIINNAFAILGGGLVIMLAVGSSIALLITIMTSNTTLDDLISNRIRPIIRISLMLSSLLLIGVLVMVLYNLILVKDDEEKR
mgnify:CR=1 FL=1